MKIDINFPGGELADLFGWIDVTFETHDAKRIVGVSTACNPCFEIADIFVGLMRGILPQEITIDEEGPDTDIRILAAGKNTVRFQIEDHDYGMPHDEPGYPEMYIDIEIDKDTLIKEFFSKFISFLENDYEHERWEICDNDYDNLKKIFLPKVKNEFLSYKKKVDEI